MQLEYSETQFDRAVSVAVTPYTHIQEVLASNIDQDIAILTEDFHDLPQPLQEISGLIPRPFSSKSLIFHSSSFVITLDGLSIYLSIHPSIHPSLYSPCGPWPLFQFLNLYTVGKTSWTGDQPVASPLPTYTNNINTE
jgi:hypothetical protein